MQEIVACSGVSFDMVGKQPIVLLKTADSNKFLPIWIGHPEAAAILMKLQGATTPRPMTHDLLVDMLGELDVRCTPVAVTELRDNTFFASITLAVNGRASSRSTRAPATHWRSPLRSGAPIFAAEEVIAESAIEFEHEVETRGGRRPLQGIPRPGHPGGLRGRLLEGGEGGRAPPSATFVAAQAASPGPKAGSSHVGINASSRRLPRPISSSKEMPAASAAWGRRLGLGQPGDDVGLEHDELVAALLEHEVDAGETRHPSRRKTFSASVWARSVSSSPSSAGQTKLVRPIV